MLNFVNYVTEFLVEAKKNKGKDTAFSGFGNEHFTQKLLNDYLGHLARHTNGGADYETAHQRALDDMNATKYNSEDYKGNEDLKRASEFFGPDETNNIHEDSKKTASAILNHLRRTYNLKLKNSNHIGKDKAAAEKFAGADLALDTEDGNGNKRDARAYLEHVGASLKYSKKPSSAIKIHSPTPNKLASIIDEHHKKMHGESSGIVEELQKISEEGMRAQQATLAPHHDYLFQHFASLGDKKLTYEPIHDQQGNRVGGNLSQDAVSYIRDSEDPKLKAIYKAMSTENLKMKTKMAEALHKATASVLQHPSDENGNKLKESLIRAMGNQKQGKTPTFLVSTERHKPEASVYDVGNYFDNHLRQHGVSNTNYTGKSTFKVGPIDFALDTRPTTSMNPSTSFPINGSIKTADIKKSQPQIYSTAPSPEKKPKQTKPRKLSVAVQDSAPEGSSEIKPKPLQPETVGGKTWKPT